MSYDNQFFSMGRLTLLAKKRNQRELAHNTPLLCRNTRSAHCSRDLHSPQQLL